MFKPAFKSKSFEAVTNLNAFLWHDTKRSTIILNKLQ